MEIIYMDDAVLVCVKPAGVLSTDEPGGVPELVRAALGNPAADIRTVHRLDRVVGGLMVLARSYEAAAALSAQVRTGVFQKEYQAVVHGVPEPRQGTMRDLLARDRRTCRTYVAAGPGKGVQEAVLSYRVLGSRDGLSRVAVRLHTGRTHQIRVQFASRGLPLVGDRRYGDPEEVCGTALWSSRLFFLHPVTGKPMDFSLDPPGGYPWAVI